MIAAVLFATPTTSAGPQATVSADGFSALMALASGTASVASDPAKSPVEDATVEPTPTDTDSTQDPSLLALALAPWLTPPVAPSPAPAAEVVVDGEVPPTLAGPKAKATPFLGAAKSSATPVVFGSPSVTEPTDLGAAFSPETGPAEETSAATPTAIGTSLVLPKTPAPANDVGTQPLVAKLAANAPKATQESPAPQTPKAPRLDAATPPTAPRIAPPIKPVPAAKPAAVPAATTAPTQVAATTPVARPTAAQPITAQAPANLASQAAAILAPKVATPKAVTPLAPKLARVVPLAPKTGAATTLEPTPATAEPRVEPADLDEFRRAFAEPRPEPTITVTTLQQEKPVAKEAAPHAKVAPAPTPRFEELDPTRLVRNEAFVRASSVMSLRRGATGEVRSPELGLVSVSAVPYAHGRLEVQVDAARPTTGALLVEHRAALVESVREVAGGANVHVGQHGMGAGGQKQSSKQPFEQTEMEPPVKVASAGRRSRFVL